MRRKSPPKSEASVALFPFLAVLLCTMGALILLLVVIARQAQQQAAALAAGSTDQRKAAQETLEDLEWTASQLRASRDKITSQLAEERMKLSHVEDHTRRLREQLAELASAADKLQQTDQLDQRGRELKRAEIATLNKKIAKAKSDLEHALAANKGTTEAYAIIPFAGKNGTRRRPIYIECRADAVILQPEGIVLSEADFALANNVGNPLAASLRAAREYLSRKNRYDASSGEPYPLLLVRPDGIGAYWAAREAMLSWGDEFGYELIDQDWKLDFPQADVGLASCLKLAIGEARRKQDQLVQQAPRLYRGSNGPSFQASSASSGKGGNRRNGGSDRPGLGSHRRGGSGMGDDDGGIGGSVSGGSVGSQDPTANGRYIVNPYAAITNAAGQGAGGPNPGGSGALPGSGLGPSGAGDRYGPTRQYAMGGANGAGNPYSLTSTAAGFGSTGGVSNGLGEGRGTGNYGGLGGGNGLPGGSGLPGAGGNGPGSGQGSGPSFPGQAGGPGLAAAGNLPYGPGGTEGELGNGGSGNSGSTTGGQPGGDSSSGGLGGSSGGQAGGTSGGMGQSAAAGANGSSLGGGGQSSPSLNMNFGGSQGQANQNNSAGTNGGNQNNNTNTLASAGTAGSSGTDRYRTNGSAAGAGGSDNQAMQPGLWQPGMKNGTTSASSSGSTPSSNAQAGNMPRRKGASGGASATGGQNSPSFEYQGDDDDSSTKQRRKNWGLRGATHAVAVSRPILLECHVDHLTIVPDRPGSRGGKIVPLESRTSASVDELVSGIWEQIDSWGIAGNNMYWKPTLSVQVYPGGEQRYADLQRLLADSGFDLKQRASPIVAPRPPAGVPLVVPRGPTGLPLAYPRTNTPN